MKLIVLLILATLAGCTPNDVVSKDKNDIGTPKAKEIPKDITKIAPLVEKGEPLLVGTKDVLFHPHWYFQNLIIHHKEQAESYYDDAIKNKLATNRSDFLNKLTLACFQIDCSDDLKKKWIKKMKTPTMSFSKGETLLFYAVFYDNIYFTKYLLKLGAEASPKNKNYNPYLLSLSTRNWSIAKLLKEKAKENSTDFSNRYLENRICAVVPKDFSQKAHSVSKTSSTGDCFFSGGWQDDLAESYIQHSKYFPAVAEYKKHFKDNKNFGRINFGINNFEELALDDKTKNKFLYIYAYPTRNSHIIKTIRYANPNKHKNKVVQAKVANIAFGFENYAKEGLENYDYGVTIFDIIVRQVAGKWLKVDLESGKQGWVHISQVYYITSVDEIKHTSPLQYKLNDPYLDENTCVQEVVFHPKNETPLVSKNDDVKEYTRIRLTNSKYREVVDLEYGKHFEMNDKGEIVVMTTRLCSPTTALRIDTVDSNYRLSRTRIELKKR